MGPQCDFYINFLEILKDQVISINLDDRGTYEPLRNNLDKFTNLEELTIGFYTVRVRDTFKITKRLTQNNNLSTLKRIELVSA
jgi:hypothetical protein